ncbi:DUF4129 domain-containing protein [Bacillus sp. PS06]|uniref:DUF4129 domain-containing protein n=1 Tax=Bacillus sp. PS06 TaxID=2764176 RepID=UPI0017806CA8|nr:DUF4129 domain-containing protein [Bacillus sp. PS06]MBD8067682.1 DUF4129 domain-containing protein [Bacillus sp. PS06]
MLNSEKAKSEIEQILDTKEYQMYQNPPKGLFETLWDKVRDWFAELLSNMFPSIEPTSKLATVILTIIIFIILVGLLIFAVSAIRSRYRREGTPMNPIQSMNEMNWSYVQHMNEAKNQENAEEYNLATRHMFLALLLYFHEKEWLVAKIWKTNWDYYEELRRIDQFKATKFDQLALLFDEVAYGERDISQQEFMTYHDEVVTLIEKNEEELKTVGLREKEE